MNYILYGSQTSPFVRRIRMVLESIPFEFKELSIFEDADAKILNEINPINQVPVLLDGNQKVWDSRQIFNYLNQKHGIEKLTWDQENILTAIESATNSGVTLLLMTRSGYNVNDSLMFTRRQKERIQSVLDFLSPFISNEGLRLWNFTTMSLYCFLDWARFREIITLENRPECIHFLEVHSKRKIVTLTQIPKA